MHLLPYICHFFLAAQPVTQCLAFGLLPEVLDCLGQTLPFAAREKNTTSSPIPAV
jgi:hypothetical protein